MFNGIFRIPQPVNEPCLQYAPGSVERQELKDKLKEMLDGQADVPMIIGGEEVRNGKLADQALFNCSFFMFDSVVDTHIVQYDRFACKCGFDDRVVF